MQRRSHLGQPELSDETTVRFRCGHSAPRAEVTETTGATGTATTRAPMCEDCLTAYAFAADMPSTWQT